MPLRFLGEVRSQRTVVSLAGLMVSALLLISTRSENAGDSVDYARDVASAPSLATPSLFEPGHLLWRPIGVLLRGDLGQSSAGGAAATRDAQRTLTVVAIGAVALLTMSMGLLVLESVGSLAAAGAAMAMTAFGAAVANFGQSGAPYVPGIALIALALTLGTLGQKPVRQVRAALAGVVLAAAVLVWLPYVLVVPASLLAIYLGTPGDEGHDRRAVLWATASCALVGAGAYVTAAAALNIRSISAFVGWVAGSSHGISRPGLARVIIGLPRSFVHMGNDGREIRRYLLGDPLNPVSTAQVMVLPVWPKLLIFYSVLAAVMWYALQRPKGRNLLLVFVVALAPVAALGAAWSGGEEERYIGLFPFLLPLVIWSAWSAAREGHRLLPGAVVVLALLWLSNVLAFNPLVARARSAQVEARLGCAAPMLDARSVIVVPEQSDPLVIFSRDRLDELPRRVGTSVVYVLPPRAKPGLTWEGTLNAVARTTIQSGGRVWVPAYVRDTIPPRSVGWVEGALDVRWSEVQGAFSGLALRRPCQATELLEVVAPPPAP